MYVVGADAMVLVEGVARPFGPEHAVDTQLRALCTEARPRFAFPSMAWGDAEKTICADCLDAVTTPGFEEDGTEVTDEPVAEVEVEAELTVAGIAETPQAAEADLAAVAPVAAVVEVAAVAVSPALQQLYASPLWKSYVQQLEESTSSESNV